jgi:tRNA A37 N6-isopentenylltransferase MiaA
MSAPDSHASASAQATWLRRRAELAAQIAHLFGERMTEIVNRAERAEAAHTSMIAYRDEQKWLKECAIKRTGEVMAERDALAKDKARLDWLAVSDTWFDYPATESFNPETFRAAIDAAMKNETTTP